VDFKVFSVICLFFYENQFFTSMPKNTMVMTSFSGFFSHIVFSAGVFASPCVSYIPLDFKVFSVICVFFYENQFFTSMPKATMVMTSASGFFPHIVISAGVSLLHAYLTFLWTSRSFL
jgi:hypothetical protein